MKPAGSPIWMGDNDNITPVYERQGLSHALREAAQSFESVSETPRLDAELLMAHALGISRSDLLLNLPKLAVPDAFAAFAARRKAHEPVAHILGEREFWSLPFQVSPDVLIPRPDSEIMIETAVEIGAKNPPRNIIDLGTGSGALLLAGLSEFPQAQGVGIDASAVALAVAHNNADRLGFSDRSRFLLQDWTAPDWTQFMQQPVGSEPFDLILANPPYVSTGDELTREVAEYEPHSALFAGADGMDDYRIIIPALDDLLAENGTVLLEIGFNQAEAVSRLAKKHGYHVECKQDLGGNDRLLVLSRAGAG